MNRYKALVIGLLGGIMVFHFTAIAYIKGNRYELTSKDYYALEQEHQALIDRLTRGKALQWRIEQDEATTTPRLIIRSRADESIALGKVRIHWYKPNDSAQDQSLEIAPLGPGIYPLEGAHSSGRWDLLVETVWEGNEVAYRTSVNLP